jgi:hypothetical protein
MVAGTERGHSSPAGAKSERKGIRFNGQSTYNLPLPSPHLEHPDTRLHLQSIRQTSRLRAFNAIRLPSGDGPHRIVDVEGPSRSTIVFNQIFLRSAAKPTDERKVKTTP